MDMSELREELESMTVEKLTELLQILSLKGAFRVKADKINALLDYYSNKDCIKNLLNNLEPFDKELLTCIVQSEYRPASDDIKKIYEKHSIERDWYYSYTSYSKTSKINAILINGRAMLFVHKELSKIIPKYEPEFTIMEEFATMDDYEWQIIGRADRYSDFDMLVKFINTQNVPATKVGGLMGKSSLLKFHKLTCYEDILRGDILQINEIKKASDTTVSFGMIQLLRVSGVVDIYKDKYKLDEKASHFMGLDMVSKASYLFESYMKCKGAINECQRIIANKFSFSKAGYDLTGPRRAVIDMLTICPMREWIDADAFKVQFRRTNHSFLQSVVSEVYIRDEYHKQYYGEPSWNEFEYYFIDVVLMEYLAVLGVVDVCANTYWDNYDTHAFPVVECFRITELGMYLFGLTEEYNPKEELGEIGGSGFVVQPNFDIIISNGGQRMVYEIYFDRFLEKTVEDPQVSIYKLDFSGIVKALEIGIAISELRDYLQENSTMPVPENVMAALGDWETQSARIRIRTVTIVETDDEFLLEEIKSYRGMKDNVLGEIQNALVIQPSKSQKVKKLIEKNGRFCIQPE